MGDTILSKPSVILYKSKSTLQQGLLAYFYTWRGEKPPEDLEKLKPIKKEIHPWINYVWWDKPTAGVPAEFFAVMWLGYLYVPSSGEYRFYITTDDGSRLWIDEKLVIDAWKDQPPTTYVSDPVFLEKGYHRLKYYFYNRYAFAEAVLGWIPPVGEPGVITQKYFRICSGDAIRFTGLPKGYGVEIIGKNVRKQCVVKNEECNIPVSWNELPLYGKIRIIDERGSVIHESPEELEFWCGDEIKVMVSFMK
ncbi:MAG: beta-glucosidase [Thermoprotei archaeon]|nr:MAG: beta-glucosidase [Thermoprotei archaeon]